MKRANNNNRTTVKEKYDRPFAKLLRELKDKYNVSQEEIAQALHTSRQTISNYSLGTTIPDIYSAEKIVDFFNDKYNLNYSLDYWLGKEKIAENTERKSLLIPNVIVEKLKQYQTNEIYSLTLEILLNNEDFLAALSQYLIHPYLSTLVNNNRFMLAFFNFSENAEPNSYLEGRKFKYYDVIEKLPSLVTDSKKYIDDQLEHSDNLLFEYLDYLKTNGQTLPPIDSVFDLIENETTAERKKRKAEERRIDEGIKSILKSKKCQKIASNYSDFKKRKEVIKSERSGN